MARAHAHIHLHANDKITQRWQWLDVACGKVQKYCTAGHVCANSRSDGEAKGLVDAAMMHEHMSNERASPSVRGAEKIHEGWTWPSEEDPIW